MKPTRIVAVLALLVTAAVLVLGPRSSDQEIGRADRVLVVSIPTLTWDRVADDMPPNITALLGRSAVASASVRTIGVDTDLAEGYATIGAGNRASVPPGAGSLAFPPDVEFDGELVSDVYHRRYGVSPDGAQILQIGAAAIQRRNDDLLYGTEVGSLGTALREAGRSAALVANADLELDPPVEDLHRESSLAVMDDVGQIRYGRVDPGLLASGVDTPSGVALDEGEVVAAAADAWNHADVVLVELSDLLRAEDSESVVTPAVADAADTEALRATDDMVGRLVDMVDLSHDTVILVSPVAPRGPDQLVVSAMAGPGIRPGLARSGTTRRDGYTTLPDVGPTVLAALGIDKPGAMNGAPFASSGGGAPDHAEFRALADDNTSALFRNHLAGPLTVIFIVSQVLTYALAAFALTTGRLGWSRAAAFLLLAGMAVPFCSFFIGVTPYWHLGIGGALMAVFGAAAALAWLIRAAMARLDTARPRPVRERAIVPPLAVMAATAVLLVADIAVGGPLQIDTAFGYGGGAIVAGRFAGYGNLAWALMVAALIISVTAFWGRWRMRVGDEPTTRDRRFALGVVAGVFSLAVLAVGFPTLGANVGGTLSVVSGLLIVFLLLADVRLDLRKLFGVGFVTVAVLAVFGAIDVSRPAADQTHLGRLIDQTLGDEGIAGLGTVIQRKVNANLSILFSSVWSFVIPAALAFLAFLIWRPPRFLRQLFVQVPGMRACVIGVLATGVVGGLVNDSGIAIPAIMLTLLVPHAAYVIVVAGIGDARSRDPVPPEPNG